MDDFCREKGIKREYSVARTPQQNGVAERRNRTLIEAARTMLADSKLPTTFWAEAVSTACYVQNRVLVVKPHNKTPYELFRGKFDGKSDKGLFLGYSLSSKAFRVYNTRTKRVEENLHIGFLENKPMIEGTGPKWLFDIDSLTQSMNYVPVTAGTVSNDSVGKSKENSQDSIVMPIWKDTSYFDSPTKDVDNGEPKTADDAQKQVEDGLNNENAEQERFIDDSSTKDVNVVEQQVNTASPDVNTGSLKLNVVGPSVSTASPNEEDNIEEEPEIEPTSISKALSDSSWVEAMREELLQFKLQQVWILVDLPNGKKAIGTKWGGQDRSNIFYQEAKKELLCLYKSMRMTLSLAQQTRSYDTGFEKLMKDKFQMSFSMDKYVAEILKKFNYSDVKSASTPIDLEKPLVKDGDADDIDVHLYRSMIGSLMFISWLNKKQTVVATSTTDVAAANCCGQVKHVEYLMLNASLFEVMYKKEDNSLGSGPRCQDTILGDVNAQTRFEITSKQSIDPPLSRGYTLGSGEDNMKLIGIDGILLRLVLPIFVSAVKRMLILLVQVSAIEVNGVRQLQALVDKKRVIVTESSIRRDLHLNDAEGTDCLPTATIFEELARIGAKSTAWNEFSSSMEAEVPQYEAEHEESVPTPSNDPQPSGEDSMQLTDLMVLCTKLKTQVLNLPKAKDAQAKEIAALQKRIQRLERRKMSRPTGLKRLRKVGMSRRVESSEDQESLGAPEDASKQGRSIEDIDADVDDDVMHVEAKVDEKDEQSKNPNDTTADEAVTTASIDDSAIPTTIEEITLAQTLIQINAAKPKVVTTAAITTTTSRPKDRGVVVQEPSKFRVLQETQPSSSKDKGKGIMIEPEVPLKRKDQIALDEQIARDIQAKLDAELLEEQKLARKQEEEANIALIKFKENTQGYG
ncbi:putative ribonuclease H-like domain-containing protein [Tanacetum coccineum]